MFSTIPQKSSSGSGIDWNSIFRRAQMLGGIGNIAGGIGSLFSRNPASDFSKYLDQYPELMSKVYSPYITTGEDASKLLQSHLKNLIGSGANVQNNFTSMMGNLPRLQQQYEQTSNLTPELINQYKRLTYDPTSLMKDIGKTFQESPGYKFQTKQALEAANRAAAAGGMLGSPKEQQDISEIINELANQDYYNYVDKGMKSYGVGLSGMQGLQDQGTKGIQNLFDIGTKGEMDLYNTGLRGYDEMAQRGYDSSRSLADNIASYLMQKGNIAAESTKYNNNSLSKIINSFLSGGLSLFNL